MHLAAFDGDETLRGGVTEAQTRRMNSNPRSLAPAS